MEIGIGNIEAFKYYIGMLKAVKEEYVLLITENGISVRTMDDSHIVMLDAQLRNQGNVDTAKLVEEKIMLNVAELSKFLSRIDKDENVKLLYEKDQEKVIIISRKGGRSRQFEMKVMDPLDDETPDPRLKANVKAHISTKSFENVLRDVELVSEHVKIESEKGVFKITGVGDMGSAVSQWKEGSEDLKELRVDGDSCATYVLKPLKEWIDSVKAKSPAIILEWSTDLPLQITLMSDEAGVTAKYYIAPCIGG
jgi:proliferating cell nuclear antigen